MVYILSPVTQDKRHSKIQQVLLDRKRLKYYSAIVLKLKGQGAGEVPAGRLRKGGRQRL